MGWEFESLFDQRAGAEFVPDMWKSEPTEISVGRMGYRVKTVKAGKRLDADIYPFFGRDQIGRCRAAKENASSESVRKMNQRNAIRHFIQLVEENFTEDDISLTLTYQGTPPEYERACKDIRNFLNRVKRMRKRRGLPEMRYVYTIEGNEEGLLRRIHVHMILSGGIRREELERLWAKGYANCDRLQPDENGLEAIARYLVKQQKNRRKWCASRNLKQPKVRVSDSKCSNAKVRRIAYDFDNQAKAVTEKLYPGYVFTKASVYYSDVIDGVYIRVTMRRR